MNKNVSSHSDVIITTFPNGLGRITLNRVDKLNALTLDMIDCIYQTLLGWVNTSDVRLILLDANGRAFCTGGDIVSLQRNKQQSTSNLNSSKPASRYTLYNTTFTSTSYAEAFFRHQYTLDFLLSVYPKPILTFLNGFTAGGGSGLSFHTSHRIVNSEAFIFAMPECAIGLTPDVGFSYILSRLPIGIGEYIGLTGRRFNAIDMDFLGFCDAIVNSTTFDSWKKIVVDHPNWKEMLLEIPCSKNFEVVMAWINSLKLQLGSSSNAEGRMASKPKQSIFEKHSELIQKVFTANTVEEILRRIEKILSKRHELIPSEQEGFLRECLAMMKQNSPTSMMITICMLQANRNVRTQLNQFFRNKLERESLRQALKMEFRVCLRMVGPNLRTITESMVREEKGVFSNVDIQSTMHSDFYIGVHSKLIARNPSNDFKWNLAPTTAQIDSYFESFRKYPLLVYADDGTEGKQPLTKITNCEDLQLDECQLGWNWKSVDRLPRFLRIASKL